MAKLDGFHKGVDLGGWLSQCDHTRERYETFITEKDLEIIASWGADHVRVPIDYELLEDKEGNPDPSGEIYIDRAVSWCKKFGLNIVLDLHKTFGYSFDNGENESGFFDNEVYQERFIRLWERIARKYGQYENMLIFELLNEVTDQKYGPVWNRISTECIRRIRAIAPTIRILLGGYWNNSADAVKDLEMPYDDHVIYNFHSYDPLIFTHQGAEWIKDILPTDIRISMDMTLGEIEQVINEKAPLIKDTLKITTSPDRKIDADFFKGRFAEPVRIAKERGTELYCGEYGVIDKAKPEDIVKWYRAIHEAFEEYGIGRATWSYKQMDFGLSDTRLDGVREELLRYL